MNEAVVVIKLNPQRQELWQYTGQMLHEEGALRLIEAFFDRPDRPFHGLTFGKGDRFVEAYFSDRWYNIFEMHDREDDHLKGWYCNISLPAEFQDGQIAYVDLALDLLVFPDGRQLVLDEDEFDALAVDDLTRAGARRALQELQMLFSESPEFRLAERFGSQRQG